MSAIASVARLTATLAVFSLHNRRARSSAWLAPNSSPISQTARPFAESLVSSSRHIIVARVSVKSLLPARPTSHANVIAQGLRSPVQNIVLTRTGSTSGSGSPEPRSDSSMPYEHAYYCAPRNKSRLKQSLSSRCTAGFRAAYDRCGSNSVLGRCRLNVRIIQESGRPRTSIDRPQITPPPSRDCARRPGPRARPAVGAGAPPCCCRVRR